MTEEQQFKVTDRRGFAEDGTTKPVSENQSEPPVETPPAAETSVSQDKSNDEAAGQGDKNAAEASGQQGKSKKAYQPIDFPTYILGYYTQGMVLLGETPNPYTQKKEEDVESVRHIIDVLSMIEQKTSGNLSSEEKQLLESVLYELRMKFMAKTSRIKL